MNLELTTESFGVDRQDWVGSRHGLNEARPCTLQGDAFTGDLVEDGWIKSGAPLGQVTATGRYAPHNAAGVDGTALLAGFLLVSVRHVGNPVGALLDHGKVVLSRLPVTVDAADLPASFNAVL